MDPMTMQLIGTAATNILPKLMGGEDDEKLLQLLGTLNPGGNLQQLPAGFDLPQPQQLGQQLLGGR